jgi:DNA-binding CsgD family transcriptional regulator
MDRDSLALLLDQGLSLAEIGRRFGRDPKTVAYWVSKHGLAADRPEFSSRSRVTKEALEPLAREGRSLAEIATELEISITTVRYWLNRSGLEEVRRANRGPGVHGGKKHVDLVCRIHGLTRHILREEGCYRCAVCRSEAVTRRRRLVKATLVEEAGGRCVICGYDRCIAALHFHHADPGAKSFALSKSGVTRSLAAARAEAGKCVLLCSNCHAEVEAGVSAPP